jgi:hypothetical protein
MNRPKTFPSLFKVPSTVRRDQPVKKNITDLNSTVQNFQNLLDDSFFNDIDENVLSIPEQNTLKPVKRNRTFTGEGL